jgi:hypothetical protein
MGSPFLEEIFDDARSFLDKVRLSNPIWTEPEKVEELEWYRRWLFRGHGDCNWRLMPTAWRWNERLINIVKNDQKNEFQKIRGVLRTKANLGDDERRERLAELFYQTLCEHLLLMQFADYANAVGHRLPSLLPDILGIDLEYFINDCFQRLNNSEELFSLWSNPVGVLARHHGMPSRLLDWTSNPLVAAYFAAATCDVTGGPLCVYAVHPLVLTKSNIRIIAPPKADDSYFQAQSGILTLDTCESEYYLQHGEFPSIFETIHVPMTDWEEYKPRKIKILLQTSVRDRWLVKNMPGRTSHDS